MRRPVIMLALAIMFSMVGLAADAPTQSFEGEYQWKQGGDGPLSARFTSTGPDTWKVEYRFRWNDGNYTWKGDARGSLKDDSDFTGTATNKGGRTWKIQGRVEGGVLTATHVETSDGRSYETGTIKLRR